MEVVLLKIEVIPLGAVMWQGSGHLHPAFEQYRKDLCIFEKKGAYLNCHL